MGAYNLSPLAESDLEDIWLYTRGQWSVDQANSYYADIMDAIEELAAGRRQGRISGVRKGYLKYGLGKHHVYFRASDTGIDVIRILHQSMSAERHL